MRNGIENGVAIAINQSSIVNEPQSFQNMQKVGPKVCLTTANSEGFIGFHAFVQVGTHPLGGRFGGARLIAADSLQAIMDDPSNIQLNPLNLWQYTVWDSPNAHEKMHYDNFERIFELCSHCLDMVVEGPDEPVFTVVESDMPRLMGMTDIPALLGEAFANQQPVPKVRLNGRRLVTVGEHTVISEREDEFLAGAVETLQMLKQEAPGMIGWMILKKEGDAGIGPFQFAPKEFWQSVETLGANPPDTPRNNFGLYGKDYDGVAIPHKGYPKYYVHMEWEDADSLMFGLSLTGVNPKIRKIHDEGVMQHLAHVPPYYRIFAPMMEDMVFFH